MEFKEVIIRNFNLFTVQELLEIKNAIDVHLGGDYLRDNAISLMTSCSKLHAVKFVKERTGWGLKESKEYCDNLQLTKTTNLL